MAGWKKEKEEALENFKKWFTFVEQDKWNECFYFLDEADNEILFFNENSRYLLWSYRKKRETKPNPFSRRYSMHSIDKKFKKFGIVKK